MTDLCPVAVASENATQEVQPATASESYLQALKETKLCDVIFTFENCDDRIEAHQLFLRLRSPVFFAMFRGQGANVGKMKEVKVVGITPQRFQEFLEFMYADKFEVNIAGALDLLHLAHEYKVHPLIKKCENLLKTEIKLQDAVEVFETARKYKHVTLERQAGDIMVKYLGDLSKNQNFLTVQEGTLAYLLRRDDLTVDEVDLFKLVLKWGNNKLRDSAEFDELKQVLVNLLPLVRFTNMSPNELASVVVPLNLLSAQDTVAVYSFFATEDSKRQAASAVLRFSTTPRNTGKTEYLVSFYRKGTATETKQNGVNPLKECMSFSPKHGTFPRVSKVWDGHSSRSHAITGIVIHWPTRVTAAKNPYTGSIQREGDFKFKLSVMWSAGTINDQSVVQKFCIVLNTFPTGTEIPVKPPIELISGASYCIVVEDLLRYSQDFPRILYQYAQKATGSGVMEQSLNVPIKRSPLELKAIQRNAGLNGASTSSYAHIRLIQGIRISLV